MAPGRSDESEMFALQPAVPLVVVPGHEGPSLGHFLVHVNDNGQTAEATLTTSDHFTCFISLVFFLHLTFAVIQ